MRLKAAAPATVTGKVRPRPLAQAGKEGGPRGDHARPESASRETCQRMEIDGRTGCSATG